MSIVNVHQLVSGGRVVKHVDHHNGKFMKAWLPKASTEKMNVPWWLSKTPEGHTVMARQIAGAIARHIVTYAEVGETATLTSTWDLLNSVRVDVYLPLGTEVCVKMG